MMTLSDIKKINIREYLGRMGISPAKENNRYGLYNSPFREDHNASMKVDYNQNLWIDYGTGEGGSIIDLAMRINNTSLNETIAELNKYDNATQRQPDSFSFHRKDTPIVSPIPAITITDIKQLAHPALLGYLNERSIDAGIAKRYCSEVHYFVAGKPYFAIGFRNDAGGWELRNKNFKGCSTPKNITTINNGSNSVMVFEGFMDFLSYLSLKRNQSPTIDTAVLNSVANLAKAIPFLQSHQTVHTFLDNDDAGRNAVVQMRKSLPNSEVIDQSAFYWNHKDLNDYLHSCSITKPAMKIKPSRGRRM